MEFITVGPRPAKLETKPSEIYMRHIDSSKRRHSSSPDKGINEQGPSDRDESDIDPQALSDAICNLDDYPG